MSKKKTLDEFIEQANKIHKGKYDYSKSVYKSGKEKVCIICPEHGEFWQKPEKHLIGHGCPLCCNNQKGSTETFIQKAKKIHNDKYDYSKVNYNRKEDKVCIICPEHGDFWQTPHNHLKGQGCPECGKTKMKHLKYTQETFIQKAKEIHGDKYDYSKVNYVNTKVKICIICPEHGEFMQIPLLHLYGAGCSKCAHNKLGLKSRLSTAEFVKRAKEVHCDKYDYSKIKYSTSKEKVCIICPRHGEFWQKSFNHLRGDGCPKCVQPFSKAELEICEFLKTKLGEENVIQHNREILNGKEIDIYIPSLKIGIEYNGLYWHTEKRCPKNFHLNKTLSANTEGIKLIQIFEDEYINHKDIVLSKISHIIGENKNLPIIGGRKCIIKKINAPDAKEFLNKHHIQGFASGTVHLGAFYNGAMVSVMSFKKENAFNKWELVRFANNNEYRIPGIGDKLFKYFINNYHPQEIKSFADRRWTLDEKNNLYTKLGFSFSGFLSPEYRYYNPKDGELRQHKFGFRKDRLNRKYGLPLSMTESEMTKQLGYEKIWDCGLIKYIWKKGEEN